MIDVKMNLTVLLPGSNMISKQECLKQLKEEVKDKKGNIKFIDKDVPDPEKHNLNYLKVSYDGKKEVISYYTRKCTPAKQVLNISTVAYNYFISSGAPEGFHIPPNFQPYKSLRLMSLRDQAWNALSKEQRLRWHCEQIAANLGGVVEDFIVFQD